MAADAFSTTARFWSKVSVKGPKDCWIWNGGANPEGYGRFKVGGKLVLPHRFAYELKHGPLMPNGSYHGTVVRHRCDNPRCVNPAHLSIGDQRANVLDMVERGRAARKGRTHYPPELIAKILDDPRPHRVIAAELGVSKTHVGYVKRGDRRSGLTGRQATGRFR